MATTRIISLHGHKGQTIDQTLHDRIDYAENPDKTQGGRLVSSHEFLPETGQTNLPPANIFTKH